ncbi:hypothetical protein [Burkholderia sp. LMU1-1-1.1]|uniref:hypothetical protein n=1 Tax=Burkholderia sp. LMU1-1-1.1 TaxID=3135266 RepID=UPI003427BB70
MSAFWRRRIAIPIGAKADYTEFATFCLELLLCGGGGTYDRLALYVINDYTIDSGYGTIHLNTLRITSDTVGGPISSPVPELPQFAMKGAGLAALGLCARHRKAKQAM